MFHNRQLSIPRIEDDFKIGTGVGTGSGAGVGQSLNPFGAMDESDYHSDIPRTSLFGTFRFMPFHAISCHPYVEYIFLAL